MSEKKSNIDKILQESLGDLKIDPSPSVWKKVSKRLIFLELLGLNFTNVSKTWLYASMFTIVAVGGVTYFSLKQQQSDPTQINENEITETTNDASEPPSMLDIEPKENNIHQQQSSNDVDSKVQKTNVKIVKDEPIVQTNLANQTVSTSLNNTDESTEVLIIDEGLIEQKPIASFQESLNTMSGLYLKSILYSRNESELYDELSIHNRDTILSDLPPPTDFNEVTIPKWKKTGLRWNVSVAYTPEFPLIDNEIFVNNHQISINGGLEYQKFSANIGFGMRIEQTPSDYIMHTPSYDSVGYFYNIEYYEIDPLDPESIVLQYTIENIYDTVVHLADHKGPNQKRKWFFIPFDLGYEIFSLPKYQLHARINGNYGWAYQIEEVTIEHADHVIMEEVTADSKNNYMQIGFGLENAFAFTHNWWLFAEPRVNYYINTPYLVNETTGNGPYSLGLKLGIKYKFGKE